MAVSATQLTTELRASREGLFASIRGLSEEQFRHVPSGQEWSIATHLAHLLRIERVFTERARTALSEDAPFVASTRALNDDDPGLSQKLAVRQMIHGMLNTRRELEARLEQAGDEGLVRTIQHETLGAMTIEAIAVKIAGHEREHGRAIGLLVKQAPASARVTIPLARRS